MLDNYKEETENDNDNNNNNNNNKQTNKTNVFAGPWGSPYDLSVKCLLPYKAFYTGSVILKRSSEWKC